MPLQLNAQAYKVLARVAGVLLGDYAAAYRVFARYANHVPPPPPGTSPAGAALVAASRPAPGKDAQAVGLPVLARCGVSWATASSIFGHLILLLRTLAPG